jgi:carboxyl-terminal processing protease
MDKRLIVASVLFATVSCKGQRSDGIANPVAPGAAAPGLVSAVASAYLDSLLAIMRTYSINTSRIDWTTFRSDVLAAAGSAQTVADTYPAIAVALQGLGENQSYYTARDRRLIGPSPVGGCSAPTPVPVAVPDTVAYVRVESCDCLGNAAARFAESIQSAIRAADRPNLDGWVVDLRGNFGGNMWPMIAGIGPVLGEGIVGWIVYNDREYEREYRDGAALSLGEAFAAVSNAYLLLTPYPNVAVLTDGVVASAGEAVAVFFRGRARTRSFGTPTCGHHHLQVSYPLSDGATLSLVTSQHADRTKVQYEGPIVPDEIVADPQDAVRRAVEWLHSK